jgi:hypothetical protein
MKQSVAVLSAVVGRPLRVPEHENVGLPRETDAKSRALIERANPLDLELYDWATRRLQETAVAARS